MREDLKMKTKISAEIVAHSINKQGDELISVLMTFPRMILAEVNTHRMLSKNTSSSRAIPVKKMIESVKNDTFIPIAWQKAHSGMQGTEYFDDGNVESLIQDWLIARDQAISSATFLTETGATKQLANRLLEPFMWTTMLITGPKSGWENFFNLRCPQYTFHTDESEKDFIFKSKKDAINYFPKDEVVEYETGNVLLKDLTDLQWLQVNQGQAEIHIMDLAEKIYDAYNESTPKLLKPGEWHVPFKDKFDTIAISNKSTRTFHTDLSTTDTQFNIIKISVAMAARTSYTVVGSEKEIDIEAMIGLHDRLLTQDPPHSSPLEHCAQCMDDDEYNTFHKGRLTDLSSTMEGLHPTYNRDKGWCNNFKGFIPYRYIIDNGNQK